MTNYIELMMRTAGVEKQLDICMRCLKEEICESCNKKSLGKYLFPDFTAEKQLELIKLIGFNSSFSLVINKFGCSPTTEDKYRLTFSEYRGFKSFQSFNPDFAQALAQLTIELMNADELDKEKVKEILEC